MERASSTEIQGLETRKANNPRRKQRKMRWPEVINYERALGFPRVGISLAVQTTKVTKKV
jgi:hypothetical protein